MCDAVIMPSSLRVSESTGRPRAQREAMSTKMAVGRSVCLTRVAESQRSSEHRLFAVSFASIAARNWSFSLCDSEER